MEEKIINLAKNIFIKKDCDIASLKVIAALVTAASAIANCSNITTPTEVEQILLETFSANDNIQVNELLNMEPEDVKNIIGYEINFRDLTQTLEEFENNKILYDHLFAAIKEKALVNKPII